MVGSPLQVIDEHFAKFRFGCCARVRGLEDLKGQEKPKPDFGNSRVDLPNEFVLEASTRNLSAKIYNLTISVFACGLFWSRMWLGSWEV